MGVSTVPESFRNITPRIERAFLELIKVDPQDWALTQALYEGGEPWAIRRIPKRRGVRVIHAPQDPLKAVSRGILHHALRRIPIHTSVHGCEPKTSPLTNARVHAGRARSLYNMDLKDAFPSVTRKRLRANLLPKLRDLVILSSTFLDQEEAEILAQVMIDLMLVGDILPQGFPTSPSVLSVVGMPMDKELSSRLMDLQESLGVGFHHSRYVDDLSISSTDDRIPREVIREIRKAVRGNGWTINRSKTTYVGDAEPGEPDRSTKAPEVTGLIIHEDGRLTIGRRKRDKWRAFAHQCAQAEVLSDEDRDVLVGVVTFVSSVYDGERSSEAGTLMFRPTAFLEFIESLAPNDEGLAGIAFVDEFSRMHLSGEGPFHSLLDGTRSFPLNTPEGQRLVTLPSGLVVIVADNPLGGGYVGLNPLDAALRERMARFDFDYPPASWEEPWLIRETGVSEGEARQIVAVANSLRDFAKAEMLDDGGPSPRLTKRAAILISDGIPAHIAITHAIGDFYEPGDDTSDRARVRAHMLTQHKIQETLSS